MTVKLGQIFAKPKVHTVKNQKSSHQQAQGGDIDQG